MRKKLLIAITNRSSYNKIKTIIKHLPDDIQPLLLLGGGINLYRFGGVADLIERDYPDVELYKIHLAVEGDDFGKMGKTVGLGIIEVSTLLDTIRPDAVLVCADRFETIAVTIASAYKNYPVIHLQGGERTGTIDNKVRNANSQLSDIHFPATSGAEARLNTMIDNEHVYMYGCPSMDLLTGNPTIKALRQNELAYPHCVDMREEHSKAHTWLMNEVNSHGQGEVFFTTNPYFLVLLHGDTTDKTFVQQMHTLPEALDEFPKYQKLIFWNNIDPKGDLIAKMWREYQRDTTSNVHFVRHLEPEVMGGLLMFADCLIGNSSTGIRESNFMGTPTVNIGDRQANREKGGNTVTVPFTKSQIIDGIKSMIGRDFMPDNIYGRGNAGEKIAKEIYEILCRQKRLA